MSVKALVERRECLEIRCDEIENIMQVTQRQK